MSRNEFLNADYDNPFRPPAGVRPVRCHHCDQVYPSSEIAWSSKANLWVCKNYQQCGGSGYGLDIHDAGPQNCDAIEFLSEEEEQIFCSQCGDTYPASALKWDKANKRAACKNAPNCRGAGLGDLWDADSPYLGGETA